MTEYLALYDHGLDENCLPIDDDCCGNKNINIFNFYAPVYGDVSGFADGHVSNIVGDCDDDHDDDDDDHHDDDSDDDHHDDDSDDDHHDDDEEDDHHDDDEEEENQCPAFTGYDNTCPADPYVNTDDVTLNQYDDEDCETAVNALIFYYSL